MRSARSPASAALHPFYNSREWRALRHRFLRDHPTCTICDQLGIASKATEVDHRVSRSAGGASLDPRNLQALCSTHHAQKTRLIDQCGDLAERAAPHRSVGIDGWPRGQLDERVGGGSKKTSNAPEPPSLTCDRRARQNPSLDAGSASDGDLPVFA